MVGQAADVPDAFSDIVAAVCGIRGYESEMIAQLFAYVDKGGIARTVVDDCDCELDLFGDIDC